MKNRTASVYIGMIGLALLSHAAAGQFHDAKYIAREATSTVGPAGKPLAEPVKVVEFVVTSSDVFPARALDPVLHVGNIEVREYRYVDIDNRALIFTLFEPEKLSDDVPVYLQYENDEST